MSESIQYAYRIDTDRETPCHLCEIKKGNVFYWVRNSHKSELLRATADAVSTIENGNVIWSVPHEAYQ